MADLRSVGNLAAIALCLPSGFLWCYILARLVRGLPVLSLQPREPCPWNSWAIALAFPISVVVQAIVLGTPPLDDLISLETVKRACLMNVAEGAVLMGLLALGTPIRAADFGLTRGTAGYEVGVGLLGFLAAWLPVNAVNIAVYLGGLREEGEVHSFFKILEAAPGAETVAWIALGAVILAPLTEELLYRVVIQGWLESRITPRAAIIFVSILFAAIHSESGRPDALPILPLALILGYVYHRRHSLLAAFTLHATFNAANLALALMTGPSSQ